MAQGSSQGPIKMGLRLLIQTRQTVWSTIPLRLALGAIFIGHGSQKLFGWFDGPGLENMAQMFAMKMGMQPGILWATMAGCGEFFGGLLILLGLLTRFGALNVAIVMLVAIAKVHWGKFFIPGGMEYPLALLASAISLMMTGGGAYSVDAGLSRCCGERGVVVDNSM